MYCKCCIDCAGSSKANNTKWSAPFSPELSVSLSGSVLYRIYVFPMVSPFPSLFLGQNPCRRSPLLADDCLIDSARRWAFVVQSRILKTPVLVTITQTWWVFCPKRWKQSLWITKKNTKFQSQGPAQLLWRGVLRKIKLSRTLSTFVFSSKMGQKTAAKLVKLSLRSHWYRKPLLI